MTEIGFRVRRLVIALVAFGVALFGLAAAPAYASDTSSHHDGGRIEVCKKVLGPGDHLKFKFVIKKKDLSGSLIGFIRVDVEFCTG